MSLYARLHPDEDRRLADRRDDPVAPIVERRQADRREARWQTWTRDHDAAKALSGRLAA